MSKDTATLPVARTWRDIPQRVKPRAMSSEGRRRLIGATLRAAAAVSALGLVAWGAWQVSHAIRGDGRDLPAGAQGEPIHEIKLETDGVLDQPWLARTLALPRGATLMGLDLARLRGRVLAGGQVLSVAIIRQFPATLTVRVSERTPMVRLLAQSGPGEPKPFLVARDGVVYSGEGYDAAMVGGLPWLGGVTLSRSGAGFAPVDGMETVSELLAKAKLEAEPLYETWQVVSLARLASDGEIEVKARGGLKVIFGVQEDFARQLGRLDLILDAARARPDQPVREVNLSLGPQVPVSFERATNQSSAPESPALSPSKGFFTIPTQSPRSSHQ